MILNKSIKPSDGEVSVKTYQCTSFNSIFFGLKAKGHIEITSKRLLFQASGDRSSKLRSVYHSEVPIAEISGLHVFVGKAFDLFRLILGVLITTLVVSLSQLIVPALLSFLDESPVLNQFSIWILFFALLYISYRQRNVDDISLDSLGKVPANTSLIELLLSTFALGTLATLVKGSGSMYYGYGYGYGSAKFAMFAFVVVLLYTLYRYTRKPAFSLSIYSKGGTNSIVKVSGPSPMGGNGSRAISGRPDVDSYKLLQELGAVVSDIQKMGSHGVEKWKDA